MFVKTPELDQDQAETFIRTQYKPQVFPVLHVYPSCLWGSVKASEWKSHERCCKQSSALCTCIIYYVFVGNKRTKKNLPSARGAVK